MSRRRWIADEHHETTAAITGGNAEHLARVLRARVGQEFEIALPDGTVRLGTVSDVGDERVAFTLGEEVGSAGELPPIRVALAVFKFDRFEWAVEKLTELGVTEIVPVIAQRTEKHLALSAEKRVERWRRIAHEAAQQSRRNAPPEIAEPIKLKEMLGREQGVRILLAENEKQIELAQVVSDADGDVLLAVGPEGGWTVEEEKAFATAGWQAASLGPTILRAETAAIAGVAVATSMMRKRVEPMRQTDAENA